jgi:RNA polymerase sigma-70 factor (ECF subfamily)
MDAHQNLAGRLGGIPQDDRRLVEQMLAGSEDAFTEFFDCYFPRLFRFALARLRDPHTAEEVAQTTIVLAVQKVHTWRGDAALFTWLCTLCRREVSAFCRRNGRTEMIVLDDLPEIRAQLESLASRVDGPHQALERRELARLVRLTLDYLPARYGDALEWKYIHGDTMQQIAVRLGTSAKAVESLLTRAREAFRQGFATVTGAER